MADALAAHAAAAGSESAALAFAGCTMRLVVGSPNLHYIKITLIKKLWLQPKVTNKA